jgi:hypothetical protein
MCDAAHLDKEAILKIRNESPTSEEAIYLS